MIEIKFNEKIYNLKSVRKAVMIYAHLAQFRIKKQKPYIYVKISPKSGVTDILLKEEFCNYLLYVLKTGAI